MAQAPVTDGGRSRPPGPLSSGGSRIGERLVAGGIASAEQVDAALRSQRRVRGRMGWHLARLPGMDLLALSEFLEREMEAGFVEPPRAEAQALAALPARLAHLYNAYPLHVADGRMELGLPPAAGHHAVEAIAEATGLVVEPRLLPARALRAAVERDYLGAARPTLLQPAAGLATLVVEDDARQLRALSPDLRTADLSPEGWLRSLLAEAVARRQRVIVLEAARIAVGEAASPVAPALVAALRELVVRVAAPHAQGGAARVGRFEALLRGRRLHVMVEDGPDAMRLLLADARLDVDDVDALFAELPDAQEAIERLLSGRGLVLLVAPGGGGGRRALSALEERFREVVPALVHVGDGAAGAASAAEADGATARAVQDAVEADAALVLVEELAGPRAAEHALMASARKPVIALMAEADAHAALGWLLRQGLGGACKAGLLHGIVSLLSVEPRCACAASRPLPAWLTQDWGLQAGIAADVNAGCEACLAAAVRRASPLVTWTPVSGRPADEVLVEDATAARVAARAAGRPTTLDLALERVRAGGFEMSLPVRLLSGAGA